MTNLPDFHIVIPARYASQRFPKKLLQDLGGKPVLQWVFELAKKAGAKSVTVATDHKLIYDAAASFGADVLMTREDHENGTERLAEVALAKGWSDDEIVVNVQGDEPFLPIGLVHNAVAALAGDTVSEMATVACKIDQVDELFNPNIVKVVLSDKNRALYFSRSPMPWDRERFDSARTSIALSDDYVAYRHVGLYVYRVGLLARYAGMAVSPLEKWEKLEQLRFLHHDVNIQVAIAESLPPHGVDTIEDLETLRHLIASR
ncbi:3-deoxy-manno-octulosonate cytidylyltransferase [Marinomonas mediterranea]|jgi:3-deoxy-D-manno-octulosonate cytidylyltransferase|uniref:3-deoxy-manno-octulosonate cytidylyltransferase n=1 Tax=Marinomonas mediterranea (strain ATCC 700492 / JCM 21426 / NBRC 103028 / MMB-1) TaxID=717774 RepID=F2K4U6_MARM1|nr:3-deoxy-manno-octulosonate cytidylyltransferase [Marinomonas mediterranea]ADZ92589.1 3-deoxy-manno-octulosonate cytidylyltransferase [Marinomonas mediterranea MMB-1]WCN10532.1 3-deoxy-manno-octulosonate cytidylyltransferase [Marinomonas mediterranea]WCN14582.1 3-deoxy-manno-octulosonate cytidylyltransferase [Marinomonas mediterranea]WCN18631.1 3-deoxy-manno-octulosonate cytidylyltransferase [Marinomonas mediterranea MMB-1]